MGGLSAPPNLLQCRASQAVHTQSKFRVFERLSVWRCHPRMQDTAEFGRIGRYYATESMLVWDPEAERYLADETPSYGKDTLEAFFRTAVEQGLKGQELGDQAVFK
jgi:hypothetical protein